MEKCMKENIMYKNLENLINELCPNGVAYRELNTLVDYIQPTKYIVKSTKYNDEYDNFEKALEDLDGEEYFDCVLKDYDISTVSAMNLARLSGCITIPESFDVVNLIGLFKPLLLKMVDDRIEDDKVESVRNILSSAKADIPIIIEDNDIAIVSKLKSNFLREDIESLEDYAEQEVFLLCKVIGRIDTKNIEIFDPLKDFIKLPRQARKAVEKDMAKTNLKKIYVEGPVLRAEIIAIYK